MEAICIGGPADGQMVNYDGVWFDWDEPPTPLSLNDIQSTRPEHSMLLKTAYRQHHFMYGQTSYWMWIPLSVKPTEIESYVFNHLWEHFNKSMEG